MLKDTSYKDKFAMLHRWMPTIIEVVKRDLRNEHLNRDIVFVKRYFSGKNPAKLTVEELAPAYADVLQTSEKSEELGEFIANRWLLKHSDLYDYFDRELSQITPNYNELTTIEQATATAMMDRAVNEFGAIATYLFCIFNSVVFPKEVYTTLEHKAEQHAHSSKVEEEQKKEVASLDTLKRGYEQQIARMTDKYDKKISGLQKKYHQDVECLKKQVASLQKKLNPS